MQLPKRLAFPQGKSANFACEKFSEVVFSSAGYGFREALIQNSVGSVSLVLLAKMHDERNG